MNTSTDTVVPEGAFALTPWVIVDGAAEFLAFVAAVFDAEETVRLPSPDGKIGHAETRIGGLPLMTFDSYDGWPVTPTYLRVYVADCDATVARAVAAGGRVVTEPTTLWIGDRAARVSDPWENLWWIHSRAFEPDPAQLMAGPPDAAAARAMAEFGSTLGAEMLRRGASSVPD